MTISKKKLLRLEFRKLISNKSSLRLSCRRNPFSWVLVFLLFVPILSNAQLIQDDFEGNSTINSWHADGCSINTSLVNPFQQGINTSATVLEYDDNGGLYANVRFDINQNLDLTTNSTFSLKIYVPSTGITGNQVNQVSLKLQNGFQNEPWTTQCEVIKPIVLDQWQTLSFDYENDNYINMDASSLPPTLRTDFNRVVIQINGENNSDYVLAYIDDFYRYDSVEIAPIFDYLVWSDEFNSIGSVDTSNWFHQTQLPNGESWFNGELQHYTNLTGNAALVNGALKIIAIKTPYTDQGVTKQYTSARLNSKFAFQYGRVEVRAKLPSGPGTWPAIWMLGKNINEDGAYWDNQGYGTTPWPACGEIDIMEHWGDNPNYVQSAIHTPSSFGGTVNHGGQYLPNATSEFHVYTLEWTAEKMVFSVDSVVHYIYNPPIKDANTWPFDAEQYIMLNVAILPSISPNFTSASMDIDYIRVYQENTVSVTQLENHSQPKHYPNPIDNKLTILLENTNEENVAISIYSLTGKVIKSYNVPVNNHKITLNDLGNLSNGMYIVSYRLNQINYSFKVIKK